MEERSIRDLRRLDLPQLKMGKYVFRAELEEPDESYREKAKNELRETPEVVEQALKEFRALLKGEPNLIVPDDDQFYAKFLRPCKWYPKSSFELMKRYYQYKLKNPRYCQNLLPSSEEKVLSSDILIPLPERSIDNCRILQINCGKLWNTKIINVNEIFRAIILVLEASTAEPKTQIAGVHVILNMEGLTLAQVTQFGPSFAASVTEWVQRCLPCRLKGIHIINQPYIFNMVFAIFKPFLVEKIRKRILFHGTNRSSLIAALGSNAVPIAFGGELEFPDELIGPKIYEYFHWFEQDFEANSKHGYVKCAE
ncbi:alpha-tocopherol transfer protein-like [Xylocopa sonorina]|uniref:alpha-tocopherol transfer protein-like n=1 Tax=Xylocopa sonorina TaxID=1818115 RepID=UPI00403AB30F